MAKSSEQASGEVGPTNTDERKVCGIVMPIAAMGDDYPRDHWDRVRKVLQRAIEAADMDAKLVWENPTVDVIQSAILQNIYENDVVVCDVSNLNPNVMLETGLRLSTKRPTIIVTDEEMRPPFDINNIGYVPYRKDLEYNATYEFISKLTSKITEVSAASDAGTYRSFVENFRFETVTPATVNVTSSEYLQEQITEVLREVRTLKRAQRASSPSSRSDILTRHGMLNDEDLRKSDLVFTVELSKTEVDALALILRNEENFILQGIKQEGANRFKIGVDYHPKMTITEAVSLFERIAINSNLFKDSKFIVDFETSNAVKK